MSSSLVDALVAPALLLLLAPLVAALLGRLLLFALPATDAPRVGLASPLHLLELALATLTFVWASELVGPALDPRPAGFLAQGVALLVVGLVTVACARVERRYAGRRSLLWHLSLGLGLSLAATLAALEVRPVTDLASLALALGALGIVGVEVHAQRRERRPLPWAGLTIALTLAVASWAAAEAVSEASAIAPEDVSQVSLSRARLRARLRPWDGEARLALAWNARRSGHLDRAEALGEQAVRLNADAAATLDLFAELAAARGDCRESYARFEGALRVRAAEAFTGVLERPLELGLSALPPTYITRCLSAVPHANEDAIGAPAEGDEGSGLDSDGAATTGRPQAP